MSAREQTDVNQKVLAGTLAAQTDAANAQGRIPSLQSSSGVDSGQRSSLQKVPGGSVLDDRIVLFLFHGYTSEYICLKCWKLKIGAFYVNAVYMNSMRLCVYSIPQPKNYTKCMFMLLFHSEYTLFHSHGTILATKQRSQRVRRQKKSQKILQKQKPLTTM